MPSDEKEKERTADIQDVLDQTSKQYEIYLQLNDLTSAFQSSVAAENYNRDMTHPLSVQVTGK